MLYGISGYKTHGKDTLAKLITRYDPSFKVTHFADPLREIAHKVFGLTWEQMTDTHLKELPLPVPIVMDDYIEAMRVETGLPIEPRGLVAHTSRQTQQYLGTEYVRSIQDDYWPSHTRQFSESNPNTLVADCRFLNEAEFIRKLGGKVIRVDRLDLPANTDPHSSEVEIAKIEPDLYLGVYSGDLYMSDKAAQTLVESRNLDFISVRYLLDYRELKKRFAKGLWVSPDVLNYYSGLKTDPLLTYKDAFLFNL